MRLAIERRYPFVGGLLAGAGVAWVVMKGGDMNLSEVLDSSLNISAIAIGFAATAKTILFAIDDRPIIEDLRAADRYKYLVMYLSQTIKYAFALGLISVLLMLFAGSALCTSAPHAASRRMIALAAFGWTAPATATALSCYRIIHLFTKILLANSKMRQ